MASGFTAKFWTFYGIILWSIKVQTIEKGNAFPFTITWEEHEQNWLYFFMEKVCTLKLTSFFLSVLLKTIAMSQSACGNLTVIVINTRNSRKLRHGFLVIYWKKQGVGLSYEDLTRTL